MAVVTALVLVAGTQPAGAAYTLAQLREIERLIAARDCAGLWAYLIENPGLAEGDDPLAVELRNFLAGASSGLISCLSLNREQAAVAPEPAGAAY